MFVQPTSEFYQYIGITDQKRLDDLSDKSKFDQIKDLIENGNIKMDKLGIQLEADGEIYFFSLTSTGSETLTDEQAEYLRMNYNINNLTQEQYIRMLADMSSFGVIPGWLAHGEARKMLELGTPEQSLAGFPQGIDDWLSYFTEKSTEQKNDLSRLIASNADIKFLEGAQSSANFYTYMEKIIKSVFK